ncbi:MAG: TolC family protein [Bacteroidales bacterium]|nr:TolC family protein [Bacteroidales bacterium]MCF8333519.1 TolC family protein [Bacteroidales bacterium]
MKKIVSAIIITLLASGTFAQELNLEKCFSLAEENHPKAGEKVLLDKSLQTRLKQLDKNFLPQLNLSAQATYQSDVTKVDASVPGMNLDIPSPDKDQYKAKLNLSQTIYDGGITKTNRQIEKAGNQIDKQEVEVSLFQVKENITTTYFSILLLQQQKAQLRTTRDKLEAKYEKLQSSVRHGAALPADTNVMKVELVKLDNQMQQLERQRKTAFEVLSELTGKELSPKRVLSVPQYGLPDQTGFTDRPEMEMLSLQQQRIDDYKELSKRKYYPKVMAFGTAGYGRPGLNMLSEDFDSYWIVGAKVSWDLWNWNKADDEQKILSLKQDILEKEKASMAKNFSVKLVQKKSEISDYRSQMKDDQKVLALYKDIVASYSSKLDNGAITSSEYIEQLNNQKNAQLEYELHQIQLEKAKVEYNLTLGNLTNQKK